MKIKKLVAIMILGAFVGFTSLFPIPHKAQAQLAGLPFGGFDVAAFPCTCAAGALWFHYFAPLYFGPTPTFGILVTDIYPVTYSTYYVRPGAWALGTEIPGAGTGCYIGVEPYCVPVPNYGYITKFTGVSPGA